MHRQVVGLDADPSGKRLLAENPFAGFTVPHEENPPRPILTPDEFEKLVAAAPSVSPTMETLLVVANSTGHRINSIRLLRSPDIDIQANTVRWRGDQDKIGQEHLTRMVEAARAALLRATKRNTAEVDRGHTTGADLFLDGVAVCEGGFEAVEGVGHDAATPVGSATKMQRAASRGQRSSSVGKRFGQKLVEWPIEMKKRANLPG